MDLIYTLKTMPLDDLAKYCREKILENQDAKIKEKQLMAVIRDLADASERTTYSGAGVQLSSACEKHAALIEECKNGG